MTDWCRTASTCFNEYVINQTPHQEENDALGRHVMLFDWHTVAERKQEIHAVEWNVLAGGCCCSAVLTPHAPWEFGSINKISPHSQHFREAHTPLHTSTTSFWRASHWKTIPMTWKANCWKLLIKEGGKEGTNVFRSKCRLAVLFGLGANTQLSGVLFIDLRRTFGCTLHCADAV